MNEKNAIRTFTNFMNKNRRAHRILTSIMYPSKPKFSYGHDRKKYQKINEAMSSI